MGVVRGLGYQRFGALINFLAFLCLGTLSYMLLVFKAHLGVLGMVCFLFLKTLLPCYKYFSNQQCPVC